MKKYLFNLLILFSALAVNAKNIDGISYSLNSTDKKAQVKGFAEGVSKSKLVIPDKVTSGGVTYKVTSIAKEAFMGADGLKCVEIGDYVETIGSGAFYASSVKTLVLGERVKIIGGSAFHDTNIESVVFPASLQIIRKLAFRNCEKLVARSSLLLSLLRFHGVRCWHRSICPTVSRRLGSPLLKIARV